MSEVHESRITDLFAYAVDKPDGFTGPECRRNFGWTSTMFNRALRGLRLLLGEFDDLNLVCDPNGRGEPWTYRLVGQLDPTGDGKPGAREWTSRRLSNIETQIYTVRSIAKSLISATDGRTVEGRTVRVVYRHLNRLIEDLEEVAV